MSTIDLAPVIARVQECGQYARQERTQLTLMRKDDGSIVTHVDQAVEQMLVTSIQSLYPDHAILGEEGTHIGFTAGQLPEYAWVIDPIDGTSAFAGGLPGWCIGVGLLRHGQPMAGIVYAPINDELFVCDLTGTPTLNGQVIHAQSNPNPLLDAWMAVPSDSHRKYRITYTGRIRTTGATIMSLAYVASGKASGALIASCKAWDLAPALALLHQAGGQLWDLDGNVLDIIDLLHPDKKSPTLIAAPQGHYAEVRATIERY